MKYVRLWASTFYCGTDIEYYLKVDDNTSESALDDMAENLRQEVIDDYDYIHRDQLDEDLTEEEQEEAMEDFYCDCSGGWEYVSKEEYEENKG